MGFQRYDLTTDFLKQKIKRLEVQLEERDLEIEDKNKEIVDILNRKTDEVNALVDKMAKIPRDLPAGNWVKTQEYELLKMEFRKSQEELGKQFIERTKMESEKKINEKKLQDLNDEFKFVADNSKRSEEKYRKLKDDNERLRKRENISHDEID